MKGYKIDLTDIFIKDHNGDVVKSDDGQDLKIDFRMHLFGMLNTPTDKIDFEEYVLSQEIREALRANRDQDAMVISKNHWELLKAKCDAVLKQNSTAEHIFDMLSRVYKAEEVKLVDADTQ